MVFVIVEHYLNREGKEMFPSWFTAVREKVKYYTGYIELRHIHPVNDEYRTMLLLSFCTERDLRQWSASAEHDLFIRQLEPFTINKRHSTTYKTEDEP